MYCQTGKAVEVAFHTGLLSLGMPRWMLLARIGSNKISLIVRSEWNRGCEYMLGLCLETNGSEGRCKRPAA